MINLAADYFSLFGLPRQFELPADLLDRAYRTLQGEVHPDRHTSGTDADRRLALQASAKVNEAYRALKSPVLRAGYLLQLSGIDALADTDTAMPPDFLIEQMERREAAEAARAACDLAALERVLSEVRAAERSLEAGLARCFDAGPDLEGARDIVRKLRFLDKLGADLEQAAGDLEPA